MPESTDVEQWDEDDLYDYTCAFLRRKRRQLLLRWEQEHPPLPMAHEMRTVEMPTSWRIGDSIAAQRNRRAAACDSTAWATALPHP